MRRKKTQVTSEMNVSCLIGANSVVEGNFSTTESARIDGEIRGNVEAKGKLYIGTKGKVVGTITVEEIMVSGTVEGDIIAGGKVVITSSGTVNGDISAKILVIDENAVFNGRCGMADEAVEDNNTKIVQANADKEADKKKENVS